MAVLFHRGIETARWDRIAVRAAWAGAVSLVEKVLKGRAFDRWTVPRNWDSRVCVGTAPWAGRFAVRFPTTARDFLFSEMPRPGVHRTFSSAGTGTSFPRAYHSPSSGVEVKNEWYYNLTGPRRFALFSSFHPARCRDVTSVRPRPLPNYFLVFPHNSFYYEARYSLHTDSALKNSTERIHICTHSQTCL